MVDTGFVVLIFFSFERSTALAVLSVYGGRSLLLAVYHSSARCLPISKIFNPKRLPGESFSYPAVAAIEEFAKM